MLKDVSISPFPVFASTPDLTGNAVNVRNDTNSDIWVAISNAAYYGEVGKTLIVNKPM